jgi:hypothetical protein
MISQNLVDAFTKAKRYSEAEKALESAMLAARQAYGADTPRMAGLLIIQASLLRAEKHNAEAKEVDKQVKTMMTRYAQSDPSRNVVAVSALMGH